MPSRRQITWFCEKAPLVVLSVLIPLPLLVVFAFLLLSILLNIVGLPGVKLVADELLTALAFVLFVQGNVLFAVIVFATLCFIGSLWRWRAALWCLAIGLFPKSAELMRVWRRVSVLAPMAPRLLATQTTEYKHLPIGRWIKTAFTPGVTPQLE